MKLLDEIIADLSSDKPNLTNAFLKTKVLLHRLGKKDLIEWVNNEVNGYSEAAQLPPYRVVNAEVLANFGNIAYQYTRHPIPLSHLDKEYREILETANLRQSLSVLEEFALVKSIQSPIPIEANVILNKGLISGYKIQRAWCEISSTAITQVLTEVRSRLLDFILELNESLGGDMSDEEIRDVGSKLDTNRMFANAIFGDNTTILVGSHSQQVVTINVVKNDYASLRKALAEKNISASDIEFLKEAIDADSTVIDRTNKEFGPAVKGWLKTMLSKAIDTSWQIELGIASNFLADALKKYYGW